MNQNTGNHIYQIQNLLGEDPQTMTTPHPQIWSPAAPDTEVYSYFVLIFNYFVASLMSYLWDAIWSVMWPSDDDDDEKWWPSLSWTLPVLALDSHVVLQYLCWSVVPLSGGADWRILAEVGPRNWTRGAGVVGKPPCHYSSSEEQITGFQIPGKAVDRQVKTCDTVGAVFHWLSDWLIFCLALGWDSGRGMADSPSAESRLQAASELWPWELSSYWRWTGSAPSALWFGQRDGG